MEDKIWAGEWVRVDNDNRNCIGIGKVKSLVNESVYVNMNNKYNLPVCFQINNIAKHSKQLIDLIEDKDIVEIELSEEFVEKKDKKKLIQIGDIYTKETLQKDIDNGIVTRILTILSYNQYMANCYKVGGEDE